MNRKKIVLLLFSMVLLIGAFALAAAAITKSTLKETNAQDKTAGSSVESKASADSAAKEEASKLIEETLSREEIKENVGAWEKFEMSSNGCERGVYAGKFFYEEFTIYSRTYDKGETFRIISVN